MGKRLGLKVSGRYREVAAIRRWPPLEVRLYIYFLHLFLIVLFSRACTNYKERINKKNGLGAFKVHNCQDLHAHKYIQKVS